MLLIRLMDGACLPVERGKWTRWLRFEKIGDAGRMDAGHSDDGPVR
jgi:hypothetical protein